MLDQCPSHGHSLNKNDNATPAKRGKGSKPHERDDKTPQQRYKAMTSDQVRGRLWAQRLKHVFNIDVSICEKCGGEAKIIASIEDRTDIDKILSHLQATGILEHPSKLLPVARTPPKPNRFA
ncbi:MAG: hypothetical protein P8163_12275 [Candidatus Thiodiazotropha sp.]